MDETLDDFLRVTAALAVAGAPGAVLATLTQADRGGRVPGRRAWLLPGGDLHGLLTLGGCADSRLHREAQAVRESGRARHVMVELGAGEAYEFGLTCAGQVGVQLQPAHPADPLWEAARAERAAERGLTFITAIGAAAGVALLTEAGAGHVLGQPPTAAQVARAETLGGGALGDGAATGGARVTQHTEHGNAALLEYQPPPLRLVVAGSGPVGRPLARLAASLGLRLTVTDDRPLNAPDWTGAQLLSVPPGHDLTLPPLGASSAVVVVSHDYAHELSVLRRALASPAPYIALVASRRRGQALLGFLRETGTDPHTLARVRTPAGLDLGLASPAGIALSVLAELGAVFGGGRGQALSRRQPL